MDNSPDDIAPEFDDSHTLSYDDTISYEDQLPSNEAGKTLANRIGNTKVYLLAESRATGKRKRGDQDEGMNGVDGEEKEGEDIEMDEDSSYRANALLFQGSPISHLPTDRLFAYTTHFDAQPMGLEWIDDSTCVFVFTSKTTARSAYRFLQKSPTESPDEEGFVTAKPIPIALWPPEERINQSLGKAEGLKGAIHMRWAKMDDVKQKGAKQRSEFYKKHGTAAGKDTFTDRQAKRRKMEQESENREVDPLQEKARLDNDLDQFLAADEDEEHASQQDEMPDEPPSKMRSDYIAQDGRTLLERTSHIRLLPDTLASRITAPLPRRARAREAARESGAKDLDWKGGRERSDRRRWGGRNRGRDWESDQRPRAKERPKKSQQELDDELDAFLNEKD